MRDVLSFLVLFGGKWIEPLERGQNHWDIFRLGFQALRSDWSSGNGDDLELGFFMQLPHRGDS